MTANSRDIPQSRRIARAAANARHRAANQLDRVLGMARASSTDPRCYDCSAVSYADLLDRALSDDPRCRCARAAGVDVGTVVPR